MTCIPSSRERVQACSEFISMLSDMLQSRTESMSYLFSCVQDLSSSQVLSPCTGQSAESTRLLCNGLIMAIRYCVIETSQIGLNDEFRCNSMWPRIIKRMFEITKEALAVGMQVFLCPVYIISSLSASKENCSS